MKNFSIKHVYISNISEDVWSFISQITDAATRQFEINENARISDHDLFAFAGHHNSLIILPQTPDPDFINYFTRLFRTRNLLVRWPRQHTGQTCLDLLADKQLLNFIKKTLANSKRPTLTSYTSSEQFYQLAKTLKKTLPTLTTPASPRPVDLWTVNFFGSKSGIRQLAQTTDNKPEFHMATGYIAVDVLNAAKIAANINLKHHSVVMKTNKGHSGAGVLIFRPGDLPDDYYQCEDYLLKLLQKESYWDKFPIIIEDYVSANPAIAGGYPNAEFQITPSGQVKLLFYCGMRITDQGIFKGVEINSSVLPPRLAAHLLDIGYFIGERLSDFDYRGYYDVDFIIDHHNHLFVTESNVRRTGGTHVYHATKALFGSDFMHATYALSNNQYSLSGKTKHTFNTLHTLLQPILFKHTTKEGLIITSVSPLAQNQFGYIIFGQTQKRALAIESQMETLLASV